MNKFPLSVLSAALGLAGVAGAQTAESPHQQAVTQQDPNSMSPAAGMPAGNSPDAASTPHQRSVTGQMGSAGAAPAQFVKDAAQDGMTEVELGRLAQSKSSNGDIKKFADTMVRDHSQANTELKSIAQSKGLAVPAGLDAEHSAMVKNLQSKTGAAFDKAYAQHMSADHDKAIALFEAQAQGSDQDLAAFAQKTLPTLEQHKQMSAMLVSGTQKSM
jgi:putative membrane protein